MFQSKSVDEESIKTFKNNISNGMEKTVTKYEKICYMIFNAMELEVPTRLGLYVNLTLTIILFLNMIMVVVSTEYTIEQNVIASAIFYIGDIFIMIIMYIELILKIWCSYGSLSLRNTKTYYRRIKYLLRFWTLFDLFSVMVQTFYVSFWTTSFIYHRWNIFVVEFLIYCRLLRFVRFMRTQKAFNGIGVFLKVIKDKWKQFLLTFYIVSSIVIIFATIMWRIEGQIQPDSFGSILRSMYFSVISLTTIGKFILTHSKDMVMLLLKLGLVEHLLL